MTRIEHYLHYLKTLPLVYGVLNKYQLKELDKLEGRDKEVKFEFFSQQCEETKSLLPVQVTYIETQFGDNLPSCFIGLIYSNEDFNSIISYRHSRSTFVKPNRLLKFFNLENITFMYSGWDYFYERLEEDKVGYSKFIIL